MSKAKEGAEKIKRPKKKHSKLIALLLVLLFIIALAASYVAYNIFVLNQNFTVTFYQVRSLKISDNIRVVELADLHNKEYGAKNEQLVKRIQSLKPDLIFYAGDMMNYKVDDYSVLFDLSDKLCKTAPIYACFGNNELDQYLFRDKTFKDKMKEHNINILSNEAADIEVNGSTIQLIAISEGRDQFDVKTNNAQKFLNSLEPTDNCRICLTHYPELFCEYLLNRGIDIAFTGHAHGGLIRIPKVGGLYSGGEGLFPKLTEGVKTVDDGTQVVISRGLGDSTKIPRINNQPELVVVDICWY